MRSFLKIPGRSTIKTLQKIGKALYKAYMGIGIASVGLMAGCVIYSVIARYFFGISHTFLEEFITTVFAFTTFWGMGLCFIENEHVIIDSFYTKFPPKMKNIVSVFNYIVTMTVVGIMIKYGFKYALKYGHQISMGMRIPMIWMYGIIPLGCALGFICVFIKFVTFIAEISAKKDRTPEVK